MANPARAQLTDLALHGFNPAAFANVPSATQQAALNAASDILDGFIGDVFDLPLLPPYPVDIISFECVYASWLLLTNRGYNPKAGPDENAERAKEEKFRWALLVTSGEVTPNAIDSSTDQAGGGPWVATSTSRGYAQRGLGTGSFPAPKSNSFSDD